MGVLIFFCTLLLLMYKYEILLRLAYLFQPGRLIPAFNRLQRRAMREMIGMAKIYAGLRIRVDRRRQGRLPASFLLLANHQSLVDIPMLIYAFPGHDLRFVAKKELKYGIPGFSFMMRNGGHALVDRRGRETRANGRELIRLARASARHGYCPVVFPEGTRSPNGRVQPFHSAGVRMILGRVRLPVVTVAMDGGHRIARLKGMLRQLKNTVYRIRVLSRYPAPRNRRETLALLERAREEIADQVNQWKNQET